jgi:hypothetical protein
LRVERAARPETAPVRIDRPLLLGLAAAALGVGLSVYGLDRPWTSVAFLRPLAGWQAETLGWFGPAGLFLPSFCHALAISLLLIVALAPGNRGRCLACVGWFTVAAALESIQAEAVFTAVFAAADANAPLSLPDPLVDYARAGVFDPSDLLATGAGCLAAWAVSFIFRRSQ